MIKKEIKEKESEFKPLLNVVDEPATDFNPAGSIELLDSIMKARDELFEKQLNDGMKAHRKLCGLLMK